MPITGLTNKTESRGKVEIAVFKGDRKTEKRPGVDLNNKLRITTNNTIAQIILREPLHGYGKQNQNGDFIVDEIKVYLPYEAVDQVFPTAMKVFDASGLRLVCDRDTINQELSLTKDRKGNVWRGMKSVDKPCPLRDNPEIWECPNGCTKNGELFFYVRELFDQDQMILGRITCHGFEDITRLLQKLTHWHEVFGGLGRSPFPSPMTRHRIPFVIKRMEVNIKRPILDKEQGFARTGKKTDATTWALDIYPDPKWMELFNLFQQYKLAQEMGLKPSNQAIAQLTGLSKLIDVEAEVVEPKALPQLQPERDAVMQSIDEAIAQLGWTTEEAKAFLKARFGKASRQFLDDEELITLYDALTSEF